MCVAQGQGGFRELVQNTIGRGRHLLCQSDQSAVFRRVIGKAPWSPTQLSRRDHRLQTSTGGCRRQVDGTAGLPSAPEITCAPRQLRLVPVADLREAAATSWRRTAPAGCGAVRSRTSPWLAPSGFRSARTHPPNASIPLAGAGRETIGADAGRRAVMCFGDRPWEFYTLPLTPANDD
jgi:hypothetical protein